jgi:hypothetical protein
MNITKWGGWKIRMKIYKRDRSYFFFSFSNILVWFATLDPRPFFFQFRIKSIISELQKKKMRDSHEQNVKNCQRMERTNRVIFI